MLDPSDQYEVFFKRATRFVDTDLSIPRWSWVRRSEDAAPVARGGDFSSLEQCFASVRGHIRQFGKAPIKVDLRA